MTKLSGKKPSSKCDGRAKKMERKRRKRDHDEFYLNYTSPSQSKNIQDAENVDFSKTVTLLEFLK